MAETPLSAAHNQGLTPDQRSQWAAIAKAQYQHNKLAAARLEFWRLYQSRIELMPGTFNNGCKS